MADRRQTKRTLLNGYLAEARPDRIGRAAWRELQARLAPVSEGYLRKLLRSSGIPLDPEVEGIRQDSFQELERTLLATGEVHDEARKAHDRERERECRRAVLTAREHARLSLRRLSPEDRVRKEEMISWMLVWLEDPSVFPAWLRLRKKAAALSGAETEL